MAEKPNELFKDITTLVDEVIEETDQSSGFTKALPSFAMAAEESQRTGDIEYVTEDFRFEAKDGIQSTPGESQEMIDRLIGIKRDKSVYIKTHIKTKELRDSRLRRMAVKGFSREIRNKIDTYSQRKAINSATMVVTAEGQKLEQSDTSAAEVKMLDNGLGGYTKNLFLSLPHYKQLGDKLALNQYTNGLPKTAYEKSIIPNQIGGFDKAIRADYRLTLPAGTAIGVTVNGAQKHTVATLDANDIPVDNRKMVLNVSDGSAFLEGNKITIDGINALNPEVREDTGELMEFTVMAHAAKTITISPAIIVDGPYRNVTAEAGDTKPITVINKKACNPSIFWAEDAIRLIPGTLPVAGVNVEKLDATTEQGLPFRFTYWYDPDLEELYMKCLVFFDCEIWLPNQVGVILDKQA